MEERYYALTRRILHSDSLHVLLTQYAIKFQKDVSFNSNNIKTIQQLKACDLNNYVIRQAIYNFEPQEYRKMQNAIERELFESVRPDFEVILSHRKEFLEANQKYQEQLALVQPFLDILKPEKGDGIHYGINSSNRDYKAKLAIERYLHLSLDERNQIIKKETEQIKKEIHKIYISSLARIIDSVFDLN
jgi:hypothetical protein